MSLSSASFDDSVVVRSTDGREWLTGERRLVPCTSRTAHAIVFTGGARGGAFLVELATAGAQRRDRTAIDWTSGFFDLTLTDAGATRLMDKVAAGRVFAAIAARAQVVLSAECIGIADAVLDLCRAHVTSREQFGRPIGTFQAVSHPLANIFSEMELARSLALLAGAQLDHTDSDSGAAVRAGLALTAGRVAVEACEVAIQLHGGMGMTWESPLHRYYKRAMSLRTILGPSSALHATVLDHLRRGA